MAKQSLNGKRLNAFGMDPWGLVVIGLDTDVPESHELYELYDERIKKPLVERTIKDMMRHGVDLDILVRKYKFVKGTVIWGKPLLEDTELPVVTDGRRRTQHSREANARLKELKEPGIVVPVKVFKGSIRDAGLRSVALNEHREVDDVLTKARKAKAMLDRIKSEEDVAEHFNVDVHQIREWLKLLEASPELLKAVETGQIKASPAIRLAALPPDHQKTELNDAIAKGETSTSKIISRVRRRQAESKGKKKADQPGEAPQRKILAALIKMIENTESDITDAYESREQVTLSALKYAYDGNTSNKVIAGLLKKIKKTAAAAVEA